jgi:p-cumate 2,3-dioxygenase subunit alpha
MSPTALVNEPAILVDPSKNLFKVARRNFVDPEILAAEKQRIFEHSWLYLGHGSELAKPGDFLTRNVAGRGILFARDGKGEPRALLNTCPHRGMQVCREKKGSAKSFQCFYHGWIFGLDGKLRSQPDAESYNDDFKTLETSNMTPVPRFESYRDFYFVSFDRNIVSLSDYLAGAKEYIDLICDQTDAGMSIVPGTQEYSIRANWKLLTENSVDGYHASTTHASYFDYLGKTTDMALGDPANRPPGYGYDLGNGHAVIEYPAPWGRPVAQWISAWGEKGRAEIDAIYNNLVRRHGEERAKRISKLNRNMFIFPNLVINDIMAVVVRTIWPVSASHMQVRAWQIAPVTETAGPRERRLEAFLTFLGPGGFATPDDVEALESCQAGFAASGVRWNDVSRGMNREALTVDELQMRAFWRRWAQMMGGRVALPA